MTQTNTSVPKNLALLSVSVVVSLLLLEFCVRKLVPSFDPARQIVFEIGAAGVPLGPRNQVVRQRTPKGDYDLQVRFNRFGFRDDKDPTSATASDWFVLGDSFGFGWGVEQASRFSDVLGRLAPSVRVFNISMPADIEGYGRLLAYARQSGATINNVVLSICMENDLLRDYRDSATTGPSTSSMKERLRAFAKTHSALYLLSSYEFQRFRPARRLLETIGIARRMDSDELMPKNRFDEPAIRSAVNLVYDLSTKVRNMIVLIIPSRALWVGNNRAVEARVHEFFVTELRRRGLQVLDMKPLFEAGGNPMEYYFATDPHWNEAGHRLAGEQLYQRLLSSHRLTGDHTAAAPR